MMTQAEHATSLTVLMNRHGTDKLWLHNYDAEYIRHFEPLRHREINLLEIGIGGYGVHGRGGNSLRVWRDFGPKWTVHGLDIEDKSFLDEERLHTWMGSQNDTTLLEELNEKAGPFDIIVDDGSHIQSDIITAFQTLFPVLRPGGIYVIEDLETAYRPDHGGHVRPYQEECNSVFLLAKLIDGIHWKFWQHRSPSDIQRMVKSIHVSKELAFIYKY